MSDQQDSLITVNFCGSPHQFLGTATRVDKGWYEFTLAEPLEVRDLRTIEIPLSDWFKVPYSSGITGFFTRSKSRYSPVFATEIDYVLEYHPLSLQSMQIWEELSNAITENPERYEFYTDAYAIEDRDLAHQIAVAMWVETKWQDSPEKLYSFLKKRTACQLDLSYCTEIVDYLNGFSRCYGVLYSFSAEGLRSLHILLEMLVPVCTYSVVKPSKHIRL